MDRRVIARESEPHDGHRNRLRQRVEQEGFERMEPHELIEFLLFYALPRQDVNELAHRLVDAFGDAAGVLRAEPAELMRVDGVGARTARWLALVGEAVFACARLDPADRPALVNCLDALRFAARLNQEQASPCCVQLCLDATSRLLFKRRICPSLSWGEPDTLREALRDVFACQARGVILVLLTGQRPAEPDDYDVSHAAGYAATLRAADCELMDVILNDGESIFSMRSAGMISEGEGANPAAPSLRENYQLNMPRGALRAADFRSED